MMLSASCLLTFARARLIQGCDAKYPAIVWEEQSYSGCTGPGFAMHSDIVAPYVNTSKL